MKRSPTTRENLEQLLELAQAANGWSRRKLAKALGRDASKLVPASGVPKLDLVIKLANVLEWRLTDVVDRIWGEEGGADYELDCAQGFAELNTVARDTHSQGRYADTLSHARRAYATAASPNERALACNREAAGWDGRGCYVKALNALQRGLSQREVVAPIRRMLQSNLAGAYYGLSNLVEARTVANHLIDSYSLIPPQTLRDQRTEAFAYFVSGQAYRRMCLGEPSCSNELALRAQADLRMAIRRFGELPAEEKYDSNSSIVHTCVGALMEVEVALGQRRAQRALSAIEECLDSIVDCKQCTSGDMLESFGWWCISGCNIALRFESSEQAAHRYLAVFTNKTDEIAEHLDNWSFRERVTSLEFGRLIRNPDYLQEVQHPILDEQDVRNVLGAMGRFPRFRERGWAILQAAGLAFDS